MVEAFSGRIGCNQTRATIVRQECTAGLAWSKGNHSLRRVKHIDVKFFYVKDMVRDGELELIQVSLLDMIGD